MEGGSGDGVVRPKSERQSIQGRSSVSELYAEIDEPPGMYSCKHCCDYTKLSNRQVWANSLDLAAVCQISVYTVC